MLKEKKIFKVLLACGLGSPILFGQGALDRGVGQSGEVAAVVQKGAEIVGRESQLGEPILLTVDEVIKRVRSQNLSALIQRESVIRALEQSFRQRAQLLPQLSLRAQQTRQQLGQGFSGGAAASDPFNSFSARVQASQTLIDAPKYANYRVAQLGHAIAELDYASVLQDVLEQTLQVYFTHLRDIRRAEIVRGNIRRNQSLLDLANDQFNAGAAIKLDITRAEVRLATERRDLMEAEFAIENSMLQLKTLLDIDFDQAVRLDRSIVQGIQSPPGLERYGAMVNLVEARPELAGQEKQLEQARLASRSVTWQRLPSLEIFGEFGYDAERAFDGREHEAWLFGIRANLPIFEGGRIAAEKREALAAVRQNEYRMRDLNNRIQQEFRVALLEMESRHAQIEIARDEIRLGRDEVAQSEERFREGLADNRDLIDAQQRLAEAEDSHLRAVYLYSLSRLAFARAIGATERVLE